MTALDNEGLMRVSGNQNEVKKLKALLDSGMHSFYISFYSNTLLKIIFYQLQYQINNCVMQESLLI